MQELEGLEDPTKQEVADIRKKIEVVDRELRPIKQLCEKKVLYCDILFTLQISRIWAAAKHALVWFCFFPQEKELKDALETYNEKSKIKTDLVGRLMDVSFLTPHLLRQLFIIIYVKSHTISKKILTTDCDVHHLEYAWGCKFDTTWDGSHVLVSKLNHSFFVNVSVFSDCNGKWEAKDAQIGRT